jgi:competence protein ComEC
MKNRNSLVLLAQCDGRRILLMGDADASVESSLALPEADAVKVAHHGSKTATSQAFVQAVHPDTAVISVARNHYGHPDMQVLGRLWQVCRRVYITQYDGVVRIEFAPAE